MGSVAESRVLVSHEVVIADTSPIHYLVLIEQIAILPALFHRVLIPATVQREMLNPRTPAPVRQWIVSPPTWLQVVVDPTSLPDDLLSADLDDGERMAIQVALAMRGSLLLMDDRAGVEVATHKGLAVTGTLGILKLAAVQGLIEIEVTLQRLTTTNFRCPPALIEHIFAPLRGKARQTV